MLTRVSAVARHCQGRGRIRILAKLRRMVMQSCQVCVRWKWVCGCECGCEGGSGVCVCVCVFVGMSLSLARARARARSLSHTHTQRHTTLNLQLDSRMNTFFFYFFGRNRSGSRWGGRRALCWSRHGRGMCIQKDEENALACLFIFLLCVGGILLLHSCLSFYFSDSVPLSVCLSDTEFEWIHV
jgi:hypothetical protein